MGNQPIPVLFDHLLRETGLDTYIQHHSDKESLETIVARFTAFIQEEASRNPAMNLSLLVKLLTLKRRMARYAPVVELNGQVQALQALTPLYQPLVSSTTEETSDISTAAIEWESAQGPRIEALEPAVENKLLQRFVLHATALNSYLRCPLDFYYNILIRIPFPRNEATEFGSAVHFALEQLFRKMQSSQNIFAAKESFIKDFEGYLHRRRASFTQEQFTRRLNYGREVLGNYYDEYAGSWNTIVTVERNFRNIVVNGVPLKGKIDKLEFDGRSANLVDYKTGDPEKSRDRLAAPGAANPLGGEYWRQAVLYKILVDNYPQKEWKVTSAEFDFIEPDKKDIIIK
ncbi:RecB family exonuclease [Paraflavitalea speifideaquila]|uniref:RecB family exonuclease n=1 Tax=Paraflavitalea speifideaquila TaxID=3076558 RepID=UPI0028F120A1|nr:PD-(D/E)XK nuclease family protein [Paraflavitalea speifideiaquila]